MSEELKYNPYHHHWESEFYPIFEQWLKDLFKERGFNGLTFNNVRFAKVTGIRELDVVGIYRWNRSNRYVLTSIEVKLDKFSDTLQQAEARLCLFDYCYIAFPITYAIGTILHDLILHSNTIMKDGIGVLIYDHVRKQTWEVFSARKSKMIDHKPRQRLIEQLNGLSGGKLYSLEPLLQPKIDLRGKIDIEKIIAKAIPLEEITKKKEVKK
ncbi:MAG: hypothetical protein KAU62_02575 [Candidatus Heimdallarchaeota archaeon]|nr:hypothetical protein [Candidatus Heimdallarchaeota archaeon]MCK4610021.1 hypothetical protein [Candidatus Heimdallarchaeota archaeon]